MKIMSMNQCCPSEGGICRNQNSIQQHKGQNRTYFTESDSKDNNKSAEKDKFYNGLHGIWICKASRDLNQSKRQENVLKLCFRCSGYDYISGTCSRSKVCGIHGCIMYLFHTNPEHSNQNQSANSENINSENRQHVVSLTSIVTLLQN